MSSLLVLSITEAREGLYVIQRIRCPGDDTVVRVMGRTTAATRTLTQGVCVNLFHIRPLPDSKQPAGLLPLAPQASLRRTSKEVLVCHASLDLLSLMSQDVGDRVLGADAVDSLCCLIVWKTREGPGHVFEETTSGQ